MDNRIFDVKRRMAQSELLSRGTTTTASGMKSIPLLVVTNSSSIPIGYIQGKQVVQSLTTLLNAPNLVQAVQLEERYGRNLFYKKLQKPFTYDKITQEGKKFKMSYNSFLKTEKNRVMQEYSRVSDELKKLATNDPKRPRVFREWQSLYDKTRNDDWVESEAATKAARQCGWSKK